MNDAYIVDGIRTPIGKHCGTLSKVRADDMAALLIRKVLERSPALDPSAVEDVILGCANQAGEDNRNVARMAALLGGLPWSVPGLTLNRLCASGLSATLLAAQGIKLGDGELYISGGVESMTRAPFVMAKAETPFPRTAEIFDTSLGWRFVNSKMKEKYGTHSMGETAENVAERWKISREDQDCFAFHSQKKAAAAEERGRFKAEISQVEIPNPKGAPVIFEKDEFIRADTSLEALAKLKSAFRTDGKGSVTAGNSSGINDGACALVLASESALKRFNLQPKARILSSAAVGVEPAVMGIGPVAAVKRTLERANITLDDVGVIELNEAFAAQSLACLRELKLKDDDPRVNPNGGAIALGHPLGMSGARLVLTAMHELHLQKARYALCTMCVGVGQGVAALIERV